MGFLELSCAYLDRDSQERARGVGKQPQPIRGMRKSFIIFHNEYKTKSILPSAREKIVDFDAMSQELTCYCYPSKRDCRNQYSPDAAMLPFGTGVLGCKKKSVFDCWTGALETIYAWVGTWGWRERKSWWPLGCRRRWLCNHPEESFQTFEPQHRLCSQGIISARNIVSKICCLPVTPNMPARKIYGIMNEYTNVFLKGGAGGWGRCRMYKAHNFPQWKWI